ncbi:MAG: nucleotidyltransferase family protein [Patescibacteria group bacterium]
MNLIVLGAGFSTRLRPLTDSFPKGLLEIGGLPMMAHLLDEAIKLPDLGNFVLVANSVVAKHFEDFLHQPKYQAFVLVDNGVSQSEKRLGAIGDLLLALEKIGQDDDVLVLPSDTLVDIDFEKLMAFYREHRGFVNVVRKEDPQVIAGALGCVEVDVSTRKIISFEEKPAEPKAAYASVPIYIYPKEVLPLIKEYASLPGANLDSPGAIVPWLIDRAACYAFVIENGYYYDVGTHQQYNKLKAEPGKYLKKYSESHE